MQVAVVVFRVSFAFWQRRMEKISIKKILNIEINTTLNIDQEKEKEKDISTNIMNYKIKIR